MTKKKNYYNEIDPYAAEWLRNLIVAGEIAPGDVDTRSIEDVRPSDLAGYTQCHFFAGVGVWSYALRRAGWPDDKPIWTGSCPCQPFSAAGKGLGFADQRHLWPLWHYLIEQCQPSAVFGEQVASKDADPWVDLVHADLEALGYAFGAVPFPSAGIGAPHIRDRLYWVAHADRITGRKGRANVRGWSDRGDAKPRARPGSSGMFDGVADHHQHGCGAQPFGELQHAQHHTEPCGSAVGLALAEHGGLEVRGSSWPGAGSTLPPSEAGGLADDNQERRGRRQGLQAWGVDDRTYAGRQQSDHGPVSVGEAGNVTRPAGPTNGHWRDADWLLCRDGKWRPVEPGTFPLAHGAPARVGRLRAYGNAINAEAAIAFIEAFGVTP